MFKCLIFFFLLGNRLLVVGGSYKYGSADYQSTTEMINEKTTLPCTIPQYPVTLGKAASAVINQTVITCGGSLRPNGQPVNACFQLENGQWKNGPSMNLKRKGHSLTALGDTLYAIGGYSFLSFNSMETNCFLLIPFTFYIPFYLFTFFLS